MRNLFILIAVCIYANCASYTFEDLSKHLELTNPSILSSRLQTLMANEELSMQKSNFYPKLSLSANSEYSKKFADNLSNYINDESLVGSTGYQNSLSLKLNYELYKFNATSLSVQAAEEKVKSLSYQECNILNEAKLELLELYYKILDDKDKIEIYEELKGLHRQIYDLSKRLYDAGEIQKTLLASKAIELVEIEDAMIQIRKDLESMLSEISNLSGIDIVLASQILPFQDSNKTEFDIPAFEDSNKARELNALIANKLLLLESKKKDSFPAVYLYAKYDFYGYDNDEYKISVKDTKKNGYRVGISIVYNLFDGFRREAAIQSDLLEVELAKQDLISAKRDYEKTVRNLKYELSQIDKKIKTTSDLANSSKDLFDMTQKLNEHEQTDELSVIQSNVKYYENLLKLKEGNLEKTMLILKNNLIYEKANVCKVL
ncbi:MAG: TolC family protein [Campylobacter sp.]|nr:TolC family protein [Campylobacter sp.]